MSESESPSESGEPPAPADAPAPVERETTRVELLWDLVFVFAITQVTTLMSRQIAEARAK